MSKKTIMFTTPAKNAAKSEFEPRRDFSANDNLSDEPEARISTQSDQWVERRAVARTSEPASTTGAKPGPKPEAMRSAILDVTAERSFQEVILLTLIVPPMLGWFWIFNSMNRIARFWAN